jgi:hypothetical protein
MLGPGIRLEELRTVRMRSVGRRPRPRRVSPAWPSSRRVLTGAAVVVTLVAVGVTAGSAAAVGQQAVSLTIGYSCSFPAAVRPVSARVTATFPVTAATGQPVKPTGTGITVTLPPTAVTELTPLHSASVAMTAGLATQITEGTTSATGRWRDFRSPAAAVPASGALTLTASGPAAPVTLTTPGQATVAAAGLSLLLRGHTADHRPGDASSLQVVCVPAPGQRTLLARITVTGSAPARVAGTQAATPKHCVPFIATARLNPHLPLPRPLPGATPHTFPEEACANAAGFTDARRLNEAALIGPGLADLVLGIPTYLKSIPPYEYIYQKAAGRFEYHGLPELPPAHATLLAFGFMPVSATIQLSEIGPLNVALISCGSGTKMCSNPSLNRALVLGRVSLRIYDVSVNGVPLNVGPHCQTANPFNLELTGVPPSYNISKIHGVLTGTITIPSFSGCSSGADDLDPIFNATVSGPGNFAKVTQAVPCFRSPPGPVCPPRKPTPKH